MALSAAKPAVPRSPRAALEPERVANAEPPLQSRASPGHCGRECNLYSFDRDFGCGRRALFFGKQRFDAAGPLADDKVVNIPRGLGIRDIADLLQREGVVDQPYIFMVELSPLKRAVSSNTANISSVNMRASPT